MKITAMLNWFDEPPALLRQAVTGAAVLADRIVAADGAYELVEDKRPTSPRTQKQAIKETAESLGLEVEFLKPQIYAGQVAKRDACLQRALVGSDWVVVVDADWKITGNRKEIRKELAYLHEAGYQQVAVQFFQPDNLERSSAENCANVWHAQETEVLRSFPFIYRVMDGLRYERNHWSLSAAHPEGSRISFFGLAGFYPFQAKTGYLQAEHLFEHMCLFRDPKQIERNRQFIVKRDEMMLVEGAER